MPQRSTTTISIGALEGETIESAVARALEADEAGITIYKDLWMSVMESRFGRIETYLPEKVRERNGLEPIEFDLRI